HGPDVPGAGGLRGAVAELVLDEPVGAFAIPVVGADEAVAGKPADALDAVDVVEAGLRDVDLEVAALAEPAQALFQLFVFGIDAAVAEGAVAVIDFAATVELHGGDEQAADAGFGHGQARADAGLAALRIGPGAALKLRAHVELANRFPDLFVDDRAALLAGEQAEHRVLRVRAV